MASSPITSWHIDGEMMETVTDLFWGAPKSLQIVATTLKLKDTCSLEEKLDSVLKTNLDSVLKSRDIILPQNVHIVKAIVFLVVMYECESWTIKKAEH